MRRGTPILENYLRGQIYAYRIGNKLSQERMSESLKISTRSYADQEHGKMGFSALSLAYFLLLLKDHEVLELLKDLRVYLEGGEDDAAGASV